MSRLVLLDGLLVSNQQTGALKVSHAQDDLLHSIKRIYAANPNATTELELGDDTPPILLQQLHHQTIICLEPRNNICSPEFELRPGCSADDYRAGYETAGYTWWL
ncbi:hypothetical protein EVAR_71504_1 [Eumeta japonica]|uniref:Uncharacterized protein n=1 Tax=Eumeta variegata TaxID=151549 RepID=A0A4C1SK54_EUMVA|nr:hypothetical protein EVAR_71504_1 [Eumeta japonica]